MRSVFDTSRSVLRFSTLGFSALCLLTLVFSPACGAYYWVGIKLLYDKVPLPEAQTVKDVSYDASAATDRKRQLDLFLPDRRDFRAVVFIHGGGWDTGDRALKVGGADIYGNIGRLLANEGFGAAVVSYRLLNGVDWRTQADDVARAVAWVQKNLPDRGARPRSVFLMGHSAGAQLAMRVAVEPQWLERAGGQPFEICGVVAVSGAGYDLDDAETARLDTDKTYYARRFSAGPADATWRMEASPARALDAKDPPFLLLYADDDYRSLVRQSLLVNERLGALGLSAGLVVVPGADHGTVVLKLSRPKGPAAEAILKFLRETRCPRG